MKYVAISGGADSTALALLLWERGEEFVLGVRNKCTVRGLEKETRSSFPN